MKRFFRVFPAYLLIGFMLYGRGLEYPFLLDDFFQIEHSRIIKSDFTPKIMLADYWEKNTSSGAFRPLLKLSFWMQYALWGANPIGYRIVLITLAALGSFVLYKIADLLGFSKITGFIGPLIYLVHPLQTEVFHNAVGLGETASNLLTFTALFCVLHSKYQINFLGIPAFLLAVGFKETPLVVAPLLIGLAVFKETKLKNKLIFICGIAITALGYLLLRFIALDGLITPDEYKPWQSPIGPMDKILLPFYVLGRYLALLVYPYPLIPSRVYEAQIWKEQAWIYALPAIATLLILVIYFFKSRNFGFKLGVCLTISGLILFLQIIYVQSFIAERHWSLALGGIAICLASVLHSSCDLPKLKNLIFITLTIFYIIPLSALSFHRVGDWSSGIKLWKKAVLDAPSSSFARHNYAFYAGAEGRWTEAKREALFATRLDPEFGDAWRTAGMAALQTNDYHAALTYYETAANLMPQDALSKLGRGIALVNLNKRSEGITFIKEAFELDPELKRQFPGILQLL